MKLRDPPEDQGPSLIELALYIALIVIFVRIIFVLTHLTRR